METFNRKPVDFPVSPSTEVWDIGNDEYLVTFRWKPTGPVEKPGVAGAFNHWDRADLPMEGPDAGGTYKVTARIKGGEYRYKFVSGRDQWITDPGNPDKEPDGYGGNNSILRLGVVALLRDKKAARNDASIESRAILHDPALFTYLDVFGDRDALLRVRTLRGDVGSVRLEWRNGESTTGSVPMVSAGSDPLYDFFEYHLHVMPGAEAPKGYRFVLTDGGTARHETQNFALDLAAAPRVSVPEWAAHAIWYQVMVDRFRDGDPKNNPEFTKGTGRVEVTSPWRSEWYVEQPWERANGATFWRWSMYNRLYGGDFEGLISKLDYIQSLGVTAIYLNPVFEATNSHKYNAKTYVHADDGYGVPGEFAKSLASSRTEDPATWDFNGSDRKLLELIREVKKRGMRIVFDGVFNHLGEDAVTFEDVKKRKQESPFAGWYTVTSWEPFEYRGWAGFGGLPEFKKTPTGFVDPTLRDHIFAVTRRWMDPNGDGDPSDGIDGWRLDVPNEVPKPFWQEWRKVVKSVNPDAYITGEIWDPAEDWLDGTTFDAVMNYQFSKIAFRFFGNVKEKIDAATFDAELARLRTRYPRAHTYALQNLYDSHDTDRWVSRLANPDLAYDGANRVQDTGPNYMDKRPAAIHYQRLRLMALFQATYVGAPMIWYGTEVGMYGADDPMTRMPMWWDDMMPYESPDYRVDKELREEFRRLFSLRKNLETLRTGDYTTIDAPAGGDWLTFLRHAPESNQAVFVALNNATTPQKVRLNPAALGWPDSRVSVVHGQVTVAPSAPQGTMEFDLPPVAGAVLLLERQAKAAP